MTDPYKITKQIRIHHKEDEWDFVLTTDDYGTVTVPHFVNALEELYDRT